MRRRSGFTLVEVLVAMALILFIMTILAAAFGTATQAVSDLKSAGDLAERLRGATTVIRRDLEAPHCFDANGNVLRISTMWNQANGLNPNPAPPAQGYVRIYEQSPGVLEGTDINGLPSYHQTTAALAYTISLTGTRRNDFLSAFVGTPPAGNPPGWVSPLLAPYNNGTGGPYPFTDAVYEDTTGVYNSPSAEVALFLLPMADVTDSAPAGGAQPLFGLYRRQLLTVPTLPTPLNHWSPPNGSAFGPMSNFLEVSTIPNAGEGGAGAPNSFNSLVDLTMPVKRFWMNRGNMAGAYQAAPGGRYATIGDYYPAYNGADLLMPDVLSFDVRVLLAGDSDFRDLFDPNVQAYSNGNPAFQGNGPRVFDTWSSAVDPNYNYSGWQLPGNQNPNPSTSIPLYKLNGNGPPISIQAIQITLRVWDFKTKKTRQVTVVQYM